MTLIEPLALNLQHNSACICLFSRFGVITHSEVLEAIPQAQDRRDTQGRFVLWGIWVVVSQWCCQVVLDMLDEGRPGIVRMKSVAQGYVWWPGLYEDLNTVLSKSVCHVRESRRCQLWLHFIPDRPCACGLRRSIHGPHVFSNGRCPLKVARGGVYVLQ